MTGRLEGKVAIVVGAGQTPGQTIGNGRATAVTFAREGARVLLVDRDAESATETRDMIEDREASVLQADITSEADCAAIADTCIERYGRIDVLHNNVGIGWGDGSALRVEVDAWEQIQRVNVTGMWLTCKHVLPHMREQRSGAVINVSSLASIAAAPMVAYNVSKAAVNALTTQLAMANAKRGVRVNAILPGLIETPMAIETITAMTGMDRDELVAQRHASVPMGHMGTAWDVANAALFLASDEAGFITGVLLPVDGGQSVRVG